MRRGIKGPSKENGHPDWDARQSSNSWRYGQVFPAANWVFTVTGALLDPSVTVTVAGVGNGPPGGSGDTRVIVIVCPDTVAVTAWLLEVAE
jgi:hypothetical protein